MPDRRTFLLTIGGAAAAQFASITAAEPTLPTTFDPEKWLRDHKQGRLTVRTPQSGKDLQPLAARNLAEWAKERPLYEQALRELIGPWPEKRAALQPRILEEKKEPRWVRYKVAYGSIPSKAAHATENRAWLFVPTGKTGPRPAVITLHQTVAQGKDEPAGVKAMLPWLTFATYYAERGYVTLAPDMIGYGERTAGGFASTGFEWADARPSLDAVPGMSLIGLMLYDVTRAVDFLATRPEVDAQRIGVIGHSQGGFLVNFVLGLEPRLRVGVASCGYGVFRTDTDFAARWAAANSAYLPRLYLYRKDPKELPLDFLQIMALAAPRAHLIQTAMGDTIWTLPGVAPHPFIAGELRRLRGFYGKEAVEQFVDVTPNGGAKDSNHGWYPVGQKAADALLAKVLG